MNALLQLLFWVVGSWHLMMTIAGLIHLRRSWRLPPLESAVAPDGKFPRCSIVLAARDEEERIENTLRRLLALQGAELEIIVVDDRSKDRTGEIVRHLAAEDARVKLLRVDTLPDGWLGKCHACHVGAAAATGEWLLFTDADCWMKPDVLARALRVAERENVEHITLTPGVAPQTLGAQAWHLAFLFSVAGRMSSVNCDRPGKYLGIGAFNLVRAQAYRDCGGYEALRLTVLDDVKLGLLLHRAGKRTRAFIGGDDVECHWGTTLSNIIGIMEKNYFAALEYRTALAITLVCIGLGGWTAALLGPLTGTPAGFTAGFGLLSLCLPGRLIAARLSWPSSRGFFMPYIFPVLFYAVARSAALTLWRGGVRWRDTFYSLDDLRRGNVQ